MGPTLRIVAADDEPDMAEFYQRVLAHLGHKVAVATDGQQLVEFCRSWHPDLIITDLLMPVLDGMEAVSKVCQERPVPVILVSASPCPPHGYVIAHLLKPVRLADLERAIALAVQHREGP